MPTKKCRNNKNGLTLIETMISAVLMIIVLSAAAPAIISSGLLSSYARHKLQAVSVAQYLIEQQRRTTFSSLASIPRSPVTLDTKGTYNTTADDFLGNATITVTNIDASRKNVQVQIDWLERLITGNQVTMRECFATTIANDLQLN